MIAAQLVCANCCAGLVKGTSAQRPLLATHVLEATRDGNDHWKCACGAVSIRIARKHEQEQPR